MIGTKTASSKFTPASLTNVFARWRTDSGLDVAQTSVWTDSINGLVLSQATGSARPTLAAAELDGFSAASFAHASSQRITLASFVHSQPYGFLLVYKCTNQTAASGQDLVFSFGSAVGARSMLSDDTPRSFFSAGTNLAASPQMMLAQAKYSYMLMYANGTSSWVTIDGRRVSVGDAGNNATTQITLGGFSDGTHCTTIKVLELVPFGTLVAGEDEKIYNYCRRTYPTIGGAW